MARTCDCSSSLQVQLQVGCAISLCYYSDDSEHFYENKNELEDNTTISMSNKISAKRLNWYGHVMMRTKEPILRRRRCGNARNEKEREVKPAVEGYK